MISYLRKNPTATYLQIKKDTKIKTERIYPKLGLKEAYKNAGIPLSKNLSKRTRKQMFNEIIEFIKTNPTATTVQIKKELGIDIPKTFKTIKAAYEAAKIPYKPKIYISGCALPEIKNRAAKFEDLVLDILKKEGKIIKSVVTKEGKRADALWYFKNKKYVVEIKDYTKKKITDTDIKQILMYMISLNCKNGLLIHKYHKEKINKLNIKDYKIIILPFDKINQGNVVYPGRIIGSRPTDPGSNPGVPI